MTEVSIDDKKYIKLVKLIIPALIPIFYLQGYAYYCGTLAPYKLNEYLYPISPEQTFIHAFFFYTNLISHFKYILFFALSIFLINIFTSILIKSSKNYENEPKNKIETFITNFITKHRKAFFAPLLIVAVSYSFVFLLFLVLIPYNVGRNSESDDLKKIHYFKNKSFIELKNIPTNIKTEGVIIKSSQNLITFIDTNKKIHTVPISEIFSIVSDIEQNK